jgi:hypothetical protein
LRSWRVWVVGGQQTDVIQASWGAAVSPLAARGQVPVRDGATLAEPAAPLLG